MELKPIYQIIFIVLILILLTVIVYLIIPKTKIISMGRFTKTRNFIKIYEFNE